MVREETAVVVRNLRENPAYRNGWEDGRFGLSDGVPDGDGLETDLDRRAYHHGRQEGQRIRQMLRGDDALG